MVLFPVILCQRSQKSNTFIQCGRVIRIQLLQDKGVKLYATMPPAIGTMGRKSLALLD